MNLVSDILKQVEGRIEELRPLVDEYEQLLRMREQLLGQGEETAAPEAAPSTPGRASSRRRNAEATAGERAPLPAQQAIDPAADVDAARVIVAIRERPGITAAALAERIGTGTPYLYRVLPQLQREGRIRKEGKGYHPLA